MYESQIRAIQKYRDSHREEINKREREKYKKMKEENSENFKLRVKNIGEKVKEKSKYQTIIRREIKSIMKINL